jgi:murein L,D-transpeptidase YafK
MLQIWNAFTQTVRFFTALVLVSVLSPLPDIPGTGARELLSLLSRIEGETSLVIWKSQYSVTLFKGRSPVKTYWAVFGKGYFDGDKERSGDKRTPEGDFYICTMSDSKRFYKFLGLSYPGLKHAGQALQVGMITPRQYREIEQALAERRQPTWETKLGGAVGIHGRMFEDPGVWARRQNWTDGCIALSNADMDELFSIVSLGTPVTILP